MAPETDLILAIDPGGRAGYAAYERARAYLRQSGFVNGDSVKEAIFILDLFKPKVLIIEDQYIPTGVDKKGRPKVLNQKGLKTLMLRRYIWEVLAKYRDIRVESVNPRTWQSYYGLKKGDKDGMINLASALTNKQVGHDEADAILIGQWFIYNQGGA